MHIVFKSQDTGRLIMENILCRMLYRVQDIIPEASTVNPFGCLIFTLMLPNSRLILQILYSSNSIFLTSCCGR